MSLRQNYERRGVVLKPSGLRNQVDAPAGTKALILRQAGKTTEIPLAVYSAAETFPRLQVDSGGNFEIGSGVAVPDAQFRRIAPVGTSTFGSVGSTGPITVPTRFDRLGYFNVKDYGALGDAVADDRAAIQAAIDACATAGGGTVFFPEGTYTIDTTSAGLVIPNNVSIHLKGAGNPSTVATSGTIIARQGTGTATLVGNTAGVGDRCQAHFEDLEFKGNGVTGARVAFFVRCSNMRMTRCLFNNAGATGTVPSVEFQSLWNCWFTECSFVTMGGGLSNPAVLVRGVSTEALMNTNTVQFTGCVWENNEGTDLELDGDATSGICHAVMLANCKFESAATRGAADTFPLLRLRRCMNIMVVSSFFYIGSGLAHLVVQDDSNAQRNTFASCSFEHNSAQAGTTYIIDQTEGQLNMVGCTYANYFASLDSTWHIGSAVAAGRALESGSSYYDDTPAKRYVDDRTIKTGPRLEEGFQIAKIPVRAASVGNLTISGPGATIDGVSMAAGDRFLAKDQTTETQNGIYTWTGSATAATRTLDADEGVELRGGVQVAVEDGTKNKDTAWLLVTNGIPTIGSTNLRFSRTQPAYARGADQDPWATGSAISESFQREHATATVTFGPITATERAFGGCVIPANRTVTNINAYFIGAGTGAVTINWWAIMRQSDRVVLRSTANSTSAISANAVHTRALSSAYTSPVDVPVYILWGFAIATTIPTTIGTVTTIPANLRATVPILSGQSSTVPTTTPAADGAAQGALAAFTTGGNPNVYAYLT